jgi:hypothetical protein
MNALTIIAFIAGGLTTVLFNWGFHIEIFWAVFAGVLIAFMAAVLVAYYDPSTGHRPANAKEIGRLSTRGLNMNKRWEDDDYYKTWLYPNFNKWMMDTAMTGPRLLENVARAILPAALGILKDEIARGIVGEIISDWHLVDQVRALAELVRLEKDEKGEIRSDVKAAITTALAGPRVDESQVKGVLKSRKSKEILRLLVSVSARLSGKTQNEKGELADEFDEETKKAVADLVASGEEQIKQRIIDFVGDLAKDFAEDLEHDEIFQRVPGNIRPEVKLAYSQFRDLFVDAGTIRNATHVDATEGFTLYDPSPHLTLYPLGEGESVEEMMGKDFSYADLGDISVLPCSCKYPHEGIRLELGRNDIVYPNVTVAVPSAVREDRTLDENLGAFGRLSHTLMSMLPTMTSRWDEQEITDIEREAKDKKIGNAEKKVKELHMRLGSYEDQLEHRRPVPPDVAMRTQNVPGAGGLMRVASDWIFAGLAGIGAIIGSASATPLPEGNGWVPWQMAVVGAVIGLGLAWILAKLKVLGNV